MSKVKINIEHSYSGKIEIPIGELVRVYLQTLVSADHDRSKKGITHTPRSFDIVLAKGGGDSRARESLNKIADVILISWKESTQ